MDAVAWVRGLVRPLVYGYLTRASHEEAKAAAREAVLDGALTGARAGIVEALAILGGAVPRETPQLVAIGAPESPALEVEEETPTPRRKKAGQAR